MRFNAGYTDIIEQFLRCYLANEENSYYLTRMIEITFVIFLFLNDVYSIFTSMNLIGDVKYFILPFFLIIWWIRNLVILHTVVKFKTAKLGPTMFESNAI